MPEEAPVIKMVLPMLSLFSEWAQIMPPNVDLGDKLVATVIRRRLVDNVTAVYWMQG